MKAWRAVVFWISARDTSYPWVIPKGTINSWVLCAVYITYSITSWLEIYLISLHPFHQWELLSMQQNVWAVWSRGSLCQARSGSWNLRELLYDISPHQHPLYQLPVPHQVDHWTLSFYHTLVTAWAPSTSGIRQFMVFSSLLTVKEWLPSSKSPESAHTSTLTETQSPYKAGHS